MFDVTSPFEERPGAWPAGAIQKVMVPVRDRDLQRANGAAGIVLSERERATYASDVYQKSPLRVLFPRSEEGCSIEAVLANISGGIAGGDAYVYDVIANAGTEAAVTTQAAEKVYRALDANASITTSLSVASGAKLAWLPQETILFDGARLHRRTHIDLSPEAEVMALECTVLGRAARSENMLTGEVRDSWRVDIGGRLRWADTFRIDWDTWAHLGSAVLLDGCIALASLIYYGPGQAERLETVREVVKRLPCPCGATLVSGLIVVRFAAREGAAMRAALRGFLQEFAGTSASGPFRVPKMWSC
jgi:urease accessory protein